MVDLNEKRQQFEDRLEQMAGSAESWKPNSAMLSKLDARVKYNPRSMHTAAWERLKLEGPREYFG